MWRSLLWIRLCPARRLAFLSTDSDTAIPRFQDDRPIVRTGASDGRLRQFPISFADYNDQIRSNRTEYWLESAPFPEGLLHVILGRLVRRRGGGRNSRVRIGEHQNGPRRQYRGRQRG